MNFWRIAGVGVLAALAAVLLHGENVKQVQGDESKDAPPVYELRTYIAHNGKMEDLHKRFREHTLKLFEKHGMKNIVYWTPLDKPDTLVYVIAHKSRDEAKKSWESFKNDPKWQAVYKKSHKNGPLVMKVESQFLAATDYSPMK